MKVKALSRVRLLATPWTAAYQAPLSTGFSRQEYWSGVPLRRLNETSNMKGSGKLRKIPIRLLSFSNLQELGGEVNCRGKRWREDE